MIRLIYHISDIHIRMYARHYEYRNVFGRLYEFLRQQEPGIIVITGDILHNKIDLTPECCILVYEFCKNLGEIFPTFLIAGNHDALLNNRDRIDSLSSIFLDRLPPNVHYYKESGVYHFDNIVFVVNSLLDDHEWISCNESLRNNDSDVIVALFHGQVGNWLNPFGFKSETFDKEISAFDGADIVLLGDIHKHQYMQPNMAYSGSLISQNFTEIDDDHGVLIWDLVKKTSRFCRINNPFAFKTIKYIDNLLIKDNVPYTIDSINLPESGYVKIILPSSLDFKIISDLKKRFPNIKFQSHYDGVLQGADPVLNIEDDNDLITEYITTRCKGDHDDIREELCRYYTEYVVSINEKIDYQILNLKFENMFGYGESNYIDFERFDKGIIGIFGKNSAGKSSLIDIISFILFNKITRYTSGNSIPKEIIHSSEDRSFGEIQIRIGGEILVISKKCKRTRTDKIKIEERFFQLDGYGNKIELTDEQRRRTDKLIREKISTFENFLFTNVLLQQKERSFRELTQSQRKDFLFHLFHFDIFERLKKEKEEILKTNRTKIDILTKQLDRLVHIDYRARIKDLGIEKAKMRSESEGLELRLKRLEDNKDTLLSEIVIVAEIDDDIDHLIETNEKLKKEHGERIQQYEKFLEKYDKDDLEMKLKNTTDKFSVDPDFFKKWNPENNTRTNWEKEKKRFYKSLDSFDEIKTAWKAKEKEAQQKLEILYKSQSVITGIPEDEQTFLRRKEIYDRQYKKFKNMNLDEMNLDISEFEKEDWDEIENRIEKIEANIRKLKIEESLLRCEIENFKTDLKIEYNNDCNQCMNNPHYRLKQQKSDKIRNMKEQILNIQGLIPSDYCEWKEKMMMIRKKGLQSLNSLKTLEKDRLRLEEEKRWIETQEELHRQVRIEAQIRDIKHNLQQDEIGKKYKEILDSIPLINNYKEMDHIWEIGFVDPDSIKDILKKIDFYVNKLQKYKENYKAVESSLIDLYLKRAEYEKTKKILKKNEQKKAELQECKEKIIESRQRHQHLLQDMNKIDVQIEKWNTESEIYDRTMNEIKILDTENAKLKVFVEIIDREGLPLFLLSKKLPLIEKDLNEIISPFMDKPIIFKIKDKDILFGSKNDNQISFFYGGMEAFIIDIGLKISFGRFGKLPRSNFFIIDEGVSVLDHEKIAGIRNIFDFLLTFNEKVFVISHLPIIKDFVNHRIEIVKEKKKSKLTIL